MHAGVGLFAAQDLKEEENPEEERRRHKEQEVSTSPDHVTSEVLS